MKQNTDIIRSFFKKWPQFYYFTVYFFGPIYLGGLNSPDFLKKYGIEGKKVNLGSGPRRIAKDIINVDFEAFEGVDIVSDIAHTSFETNSVSMIVCDNVLEHIPDVTPVILEMKRILQPDGVAYISTPFLYPFHGSPSDFNRWTTEGLRSLFKDFTMVEMGTRSGIFSTINVTLCYVIPTLFSFGSDRLYWLLVNLSLFLFFPIKFLDIFANKLPLATHTASTLYCVIRK